MKGRSPLFMKKNNKNSKKPKNNRGRPSKPILTDERQPFVFECLARGMTFDQTATEFNKTFNQNITLQSIEQYKRTHLQEYLAFREEYMSKIREPRLANARARIDELEGLIKKLQSKLLKDFDTLTPNQHMENGTLATIQRIQSLLDQISQETGDKVHRWKGEGFGDHKHFYFGDNAINRFADLTVKERQTEEKTDLRNRIKKS